MATGIVSLDLRAVGWSRVSWVMFALAALAWALLPLTGVLGSELAGVPATSVLATFLAGWAGAVLLALAAALLIRRRRDLLPPPSARGRDLVAVVALQSLAVVSGTLHARGLLIAGSALVGAGLV